MIVVNANSEIFQLYHGENKLHILRIFQLYHGENKLHILRQGRRDTLIKIDILRKT